MPHVMTAANARPCPWNKRASARRVPHPPGARLRRAVSLTFRRPRKSRLRYVLAVAVVAVALASNEAAARDIWIFATPNNAAFCGQGPEIPKSPKEESIHCYRPKDGLDVRLARTGLPRAT